MKVHVFIGGTDGIIEDVRVFAKAEDAQKAWDEWLGDDKEEFEHTLEVTNEYLEDYDPMRIEECEVEGLA